MSVWNDPEMGQYLPDASSDDMSEEEYQSQLKELETLGDDEECCYLISELKATGERIGACSFLPSEDGSIYDIGYCVHRTHWRNGYATEMVQGMIEYAKFQGAKSITIMITEGNIASERIAEKFGGRVVKTSSYVKKGTNLTFTDNMYEIKL